MTNKKEKTIKYRIKIGTQWLLVSLLTTSTILPGITTTVSASTRENTISEDSDISQAEESEKISEDSENTEPSLVEERLEKVLEILPLSV